MNSKMDVARTAVTYIKDNDTVGLGASGTIEFMVDIIAAEIANGMRLKLVTSSYTTRQWLLRKNLPVQSIADFDTINIYFDGCDQFDANLTALKSGGGIHTREKLLASMAKLFILVGDDSKQVELLEDRYPVVLEVLPEAVRYVQESIHKLFAPVKTAYRVTANKEGLVVTDNGNYLLDIWFKHWPSLKQLNAALKNITGVVETSLFTNLAHKAIISTKDGKVVFVEKKNNV